MRSDHRDSSPPRHPGDRVWTPDRPLPRHRRSSTHRGVPTSCGNDKFSGGAGCKTSCRGKPSCRPRLLQRLDTYHGLDGMGRSLSQVVRGITGLPCPSVGFSGRTYLPTTMRDQAPTQSPRRMHHALLQPTAPILLRRRSARQDHVPLHPRPGRPRSSSTRTCAAEPDAFLAGRRALTATASSSAASACSPGTGSPTSAPRRQIPFVLGHALYMKAIHGGKAKNDKIDADKIAAPAARRHLPAWPTSTRKGMRETRDLLRRRMLLRPPSAPS